MRTLLDKDGEAYQFNMFACLPSCTTNFLPDLLSQTVIRDAYTQWMDWRTDSGCDWENWFLFESGRLAEMIEPDHLSRSLAELRGLKDAFAGGAETVKKHVEMLAERGRESADWPEERKHALMDAYFRNAYRVSRRPDDG